MKRIVIRPVIAMWFIGWIAAAANADVSPNPDPIERIIWKKAPIKITLPVGR